MTCVVLQQLQWLKAEAGVTTYEERSGSSGSQFHGFDFSRRAQSVLSHVGIKAGVSVKGSEKLFCFERRRKMSVILRLRMSGVGTECDPSCLCCSSACSTSKVQGKSEGQEDGWGICDREALSSWTDGLGGTHHCPLRRNLGCTMSSCMLLFVLLHGYLNKRLQ